MYGCDVHGGTNGCPLLERELVSFDGHVNIARGLIGRPHKFPLVYETEAPTCHPGSRRRARVAGVDASSSASSSGASVTDSAVEVLLELGQAWWHR